MLTLNVPLLLLWDLAETLLDELISKDGMLRLTAKEVCAL